MAPVSVPSPHPGNFDGAPEEHKLEQDFKRDADQKHKWKRGNRSEEGARPNPIHPRRPAPAHYAHADNEGRQSVDARMKSLARKHFPRYDSDENLASKIDGPLGASPGVTPDAGVAYSFDAKRSPREGNEILGMAMNQAVERFETKKTERLVKDEYEIVPAGAEGDENEGYTADEDDFEIIIGA